MGNFKPATIGSFNVAINNPRVRCADDVKIGYVFSVVDGSTYLEEAVAFNANATTPVGGTWVCMNIIDTPELLNSTDFVVVAGSYIRAFKLDVLKGLPVELSSDLITTTYATISVGDYLVPVADGTSYLWVVATGTGYNCAIRVVEKTTFGGTGIFGIVEGN